MVFQMTVARRAVECLLGMRGQPLPQDPDPQGKLRRINVVYSGDKRALGGTLTSMRSLAFSQADPGLVTIHLVIAPEDMELARGMVECFKREVAELPAAPEVLLQEIRALPFDPSNNTFNKEGLGIGTASMPSCWLRIWLTDYLPEAPRAIWLDHDVLVNGDLAPLYRMRMEHPIAAAPEWVSPEQLQAGVLLIDLDAFRKQDLAEQMLQKVRLYHTVTTAFSDQDILNWQFPLGKRDVLDWRWNTGCMGIIFLGEGEGKWLPKNHLVERLGVGLIQFSSWLVYARCMDQVNLLHLNWGPKYWFKNETFPRCELVARVAPREQCLGWRYACKPWPVRW